MITFRKGGENLVRTSPHRLKSTTLQDHPAWVDEIRAVNQDYYGNLQPKARAPWLTWFLILAAGYVLGSIDNHVWDALVTWWRTSP